MKVYYLNSEYETGKHRIIMVNFERDDFLTPNTINVPFTVLSIDETVPENKEICRDLSIHASQGKYYVDNLGDIYEVEGWQIPEEAV